MINKNIYFLILLFFVLAANLNCRRDAPDSRMNPATVLVTEAQVIITPLNNAKVKGKLHLSKTKNGILIKGKIDGLSRNKQAIHIHEFGDCSAKDGSSAGGHYNPTKKKHGDPKNTEHHAGDLGNLVSQKDGSAEINSYYNNITLNGYFSPVIGRSIIIHGNEDDFKTQPSGNSGVRVACGIIGVKRDNVKIFTAEEDYQR